MIEWRIDALAFSSCNCAYNCPCQFELRPTHGDCRGFEVGRIERGHFGDVILDGLHWAILYEWPGAIFEGNGTMQAVVEERADERQRRALETVLHGGETREAVTHWWVFRAMSNKIHETTFKPIEFEADLDARTARVAIAGMLESVARPIISPATGEPHRIRIDLPAGIEFAVAEIASASTKASDPILLDLEDTYGQFNAIHHTGRGVVRQYM
ncbi:DUF1326 domain-containing protein [Ciceribacter thiooxidans]|uniref:DUF1326 domain-containing protein n=1 Tax=Ciceribacter thiooxidans TaxID=1969821 RepID=A0ABV7I7U8_9HYPH|nr:DUF1326 domain-containing protein [Ciceribacter thiooxidans]MDI6838635.1 DUF1326 domain-containing protein [Rhizobiaceae bacterium]